MGNVDLVRNVFVDCYLNAFFTNLILYLISLDSISFFASFGLFVGFKELYRYQLVEKFFIICVPFFVFLITKHCIVYGDLIYLLIFRNNNTLSLQEIFF